MNMNQINEEDLPKPQETRKKNSRFTFVKLSGVIMFACVCVLGGLCGNGIISEEMLLIFMIPPLVGTYLFIGLFVFIRYKRTHKKK